MKSFLKRIYRKFFLKPSNQVKAKFSNSGDYWEERYQRGGNSGSGSYNNLAEFKGEILNQFVEENKVSSVIEFGCGDGNQLRFFRFKSYLGFDVSEMSVKICQNIYQSDKSRKFLKLDDFKNEKADLTLSLDVIYHLIEDDIYEEYMRKLFESSTRFVVIYSSNSTFVEGAEEVKHIKHRRFMDWVESNKQEFELIKTIPNKFPFQIGNSNTSFADFYFFKKTI